jgi:hypothetical protein
MKTVRPDLDAGTDLTEGVSLFQHGDARAPAREAHGGRQAADAATGHDH